MTHQWTNAGNEAEFTPTNRCFASETGGTWPSWPWFRGAQLTLIRERGIEGEGGKKDNLSQKRKKVSLKKKQGGILVVHIHIWRNCKRVCQCRPIGWAMNENGITPTKIPNHLSSVSRKWKNIVWTRENQLKRLNFFFQRATQSNVPHSGITFTFRSHSALANWALMCQKNLNEITHCLPRTS